MLFFLVSSCPSRRHVVLFGFVMSQQKADSDTAHIGVDRTSGVLATSYNANLVSFHISAQWYLSVIIHFIYNKFLLFIQIIFSLTPSDANTHNGLHTLTFFDASLSTKQTKFLCDDLHVFQSDPVFNSP